MTASIGRRTRRLAVALAAGSVLLLTSLSAQAGFPRALALGPTSVSTNGADHASGPGATRAHAPLSEAKQRVLDAYAKLPLSFVGNAGQSDKRIRYSARTGGASFAFTPSEALVAFTKGKKGHALALRFLGARDSAEPEGSLRLPGKVNYLLGSNPADWRTGLPTYREVVYRKLWPGIDLAFRGERGTLKYELRLDPGADPGDIRLAYRGAERLSLGRGGALRIQTPLGPLTDSAPRSYQLTAGKRVPVASRYTLQGSRGYGFALGPGYDPALPLVIDPGLVYSTFLGGSGFDAGGGIAVDGAANAYVTGFTASTDYPTTSGAFDTSHNGGFDAFVTKLNAAGSALVYSTFLGGSGSDVGNDIAVDGTGRAYVTGETTSTDYPTTSGAFDTSHNGGRDAFVTNLSAAGSALAYSTFLGGSGIDVGAEIALAAGNDDGAANAYVHGVTDSMSYPTTSGAFDTSHNGGFDAFVTKLNAAGSALVYSTFLGGSGLDQSGGIALAGGNDNGAADAYLTGVTTSMNYPTTTGAFDTSHNGDLDAFVTKLNAAGSALVYSTFLGGSGFDAGADIALAGGNDNGGAANAYVHGSTTSMNYPTTSGAFDTGFNGVGDAFVTRLNAAGSALVYSTFLGGSATDAGSSIAVDGTANASVTGFTASMDYPTTSGAFDTGFNGVFDAFVTKLNAAGSALAYSTFLGGAGNDFGSAIALDPQNDNGAANAYVTGETQGLGYPTTSGAFDTSHNGGSDAFVTKLDLTAACPSNDDGDNDGLTDSNELLFLTLLDNPDSDFDGIKDGNDDANGNGNTDEDEDDDDGCPDRDSDGDGIDDEDEDDD